MSTLIFMQLADGPTAADLFSFDSKSREFRPYVQTESLECGGDVSPDGRWVVYVSNDSGRFEVYIRPFVGSGSRVQVSVDGGTEPVWARSGKELFYKNRNKLMAAQLRSEPVMEVTGRSVLFEAPFARGVPGGANYDVSIDGSRFLMLKDALDASEVRSLSIVLNWFDELRRLVPVAY